MPKANADSVSDATPLDQDGAVVRRADGTLTEVVIPSDQRATDVAGAEPGRKRDEPANRPDADDVKAKGPDEPDHSPDSAYGVGTEPAGRTKTPDSVHAAPDSQGGERSSDGSNSRTSAPKTGSTPARQKRTGNGR